MLANISSNLTISDLLKGDVHLASPPNIYFALQKVVADPNKSITDAGFIIEKDPGLTMRLLKIVNSAFFGFPAQINTISRAITVIGLTELQNLVLATIIIDKFSALPGGLPSMHEFWARSLRCALLAKELCAYWKMDAEADSMFVCGLLHDIGQLVFYLRIPVLAREVGLLIESTGADEIETENQLIGFNHYQAGAELARSWHLPEIIVETIAEHNNVEYTGEFANAAGIVRTAHYLSRLDMETASFGGLGNDISADDLSDLIDKTHEQFEDIFKVFYPG